MGLLSWIVFLPTLFALVLLLLPRGNERAIRVVAFGGMLLDFAARQRPDQGAGHPKGT